MSGPLAPDDDTRGPGHDPAEALATIAVIAGLLQGVAAQLPQVAEYGLVVRFTCGCEHVIGHKRGGTSNVRALLRHALDGNGDDADGLAPAFRPAGTVVQ